MFWGSVAKSCECPRSGGLLSKPAPDFMLSDAPVSYSCPTAGLEQVMMILTLGNAFFVSYCVLLDSFRLCPIQGKERIAQCKNVLAIIALRCYNNGTSFRHTCKTSENEDQVVVRCCLRIL